MERVPHIMKAAKMTSYPANLMFVDTETRTQYREDRPDSEFLYLWFGHAVALRYEQKHITRQKWCRFEHTKGFWQFLKTRLDKCRPLFVFAHNLPFDLTILDFWEQISGEDWDCVYKVMENPPTFFEFKYNDCTVIFIDTFNYWRFSLKVIGESLGKPKMEMPDKEDSAERWDIYCRNDVEIIRDVVLEFMNFIKDNGLGKFAISLAGQAMNAFKARFMHNAIYIHDRREVLELERESYHGGLVNCFYLGKPKEKLVYHTDVNSLYPAMMLKPVPVKLITYRKDMSVQELKRTLQQKAVVARVHITTRKNTYPVHHAAKLLELKGTFPVVLCGAELDKALQRGEVLKVYEAAIYEQAIIFDEYVKFFWEYRLKHPKEVDPVNNWIAKIIMNSLYGKFAQRAKDWERLDFRTLKRLYQKNNVPMPEEYKDDWTEPLTAFGTSSHYLLDLESPVKIRTTLGASEIKMPAGEHWESFPLIASYITSYARQYLRDLLEIAGEQQTYYTDTDSLFTTELGYQRLEKAGQIVPGQIGKLKLEGKSKRVQFNGPKDYEFEDKAVLKGVKNPLITQVDVYDERDTIGQEVIRKGKCKIGEAAYLQKQFEGLKSIIARPLKKCTPQEEKGVPPKPYIEIKTYVKRLQRKYNKGKLLKTGWTEPFTVNVRVGVPEIPADVLLQ